MSATAQPALRIVDHSTPIGELAARARRFLGRAFIPFVAVTAAEGAYLYLSGSPGATAFLLIVAGTFVGLYAWIRRGIGLPLVPLLIIQHLIVYALPIFVGNPVIRAYPPSLITSAGLEILLFDLTLAATWTAGMELFRPGTSVSHALVGLHQRDSEKLLSLGFRLILLATLYNTLDSAGMLGFVYQLLPAGSGSLIAPFVTAANSCGFFLIAIFVGKRALSGTRITLFWILLALNALIATADLLLSVATALFASVAIGLFWSSGRIPWRFITIVVAAMSFLNLGKITMRERYWPKDGDTDAVTVRLMAIPERYSEWAQVSMDTFSAEEKNAPLSDWGQNAKGLSNSQGLSERINNLQNILFAINAVENSHIPLLEGRTYSLIPPLLVPRILWPEKPRTHEGQVMLNVHFGRQDLYSTFRTYVAWGLLPEAYANFGAIFGSLTLGLVLGFLFAWLENFTARKLLLSLEGFVAFTIFVAMANSYEMVASVIVTSIFQGVIVVIVACWPFVERSDLHRARAASG